MPNFAAPLPASASSAGALAQPTDVAVPLIPLGCLRQATTQMPVGAIIPRPTCKAKVCPGNCRRRRTQDAT